MKAWLTGLFLLLSLGIGIVPNGVCPGCITPYCLFKNAPQKMTCSCCAARAPSTSGAQMKDGKKCCFLLPLVVHQSATACPVFAIVDRGPEVQSVATDSYLLERDADSDLHLTGPPRYGLFLTHRSFLI